MASAASIDRNVGGSLPRVAAAMASAVTELDTGPTAMMTSGLLSRIADDTAVVSSWITLILAGLFGPVRSSALSIAILSAAMLCWLKITLSSSMLAWVRPMTPSLR